MRDVHHWSTPLDYWWYFFISFTLCSRDTSHGAYHSAHKYPCAVLFISSGSGTPETVLLWTPTLSSSDTDSQSNMTHRTRFRSCLGAEMNWSHAVLYTSVPPRCLPVLPDNLCSGLVAGPRRLQTKTCESWSTTCKAMLSFKPLSVGWFVCLICF